MANAAIAAILLALLAWAGPAGAEEPELYISPKGEVHVLNVPVANRHATNLFSVVVWGLKLIIPVDRYTTVEDAGGNKINSQDIQEGHRLEIKGRAVTGDPNRSGWLEAKLLRDLSIGTPSALTAQASGSLAPRPPAPPPSPLPPPPPPQKTAAAPPSGPLTQGLKAGMRGQEIVTLQKFLQKNNWGIPNDGPVTGYYGKTTTKAVKNFQTANGLPPEGEVGPRTRALINALLSKEP